MLFDSIGFAIFFPTVVLVYYAIPQKNRYLWLAAASYFFYSCWDIKYTMLLFLTTLVTYGCALGMKSKHKKKVFLSGLIGNLLLLITFKYFNFGFEILNNVFEKLHMTLDIGDLSLVLPVGMSFYIFQSLGYLIDVYQEKSEPESNFIKYALFVSFFPTLLSGPVERSGNLLKQIQRGEEISYENAKRGLLLMVFGYFEKILISNRLAVVIDNVYGNHEKYSGSALLFAVFLYAIYIYVDFSGYSHMALGAARVLGFEIIENFKQPYFALTIRDFWSRWHRSLSGWFRDYLYIPMGGSKNGRLATYRNLIITFAISGMWHGNGANYLAWGLLHGVYQVAGKITVDKRAWLKHKLAIHTDCCSYRLFQRILIFCLVTFGWLFFSADSFTQALKILYGIFTRFHLAEFIIDQGYLFGLEGIRFFILLTEVSLVFLVDVLHEKKVTITGWLDQQNMVFRWGIYIMVVFVILIGTIYNYGAESSAFIYSQF